MVIEMKNKYTLKESREYIAKKHGFDRWKEYVKFKKEHSFEEIKERRQSMEKSNN